ncbi:hypothetical protein C8F01DRAFT_1371058 [Mycena amicta]|nr:hypothetical protein C8F01DRAFT_1371058 [Mycena amicta]
MLTPVLPPELERLIFELVAWHDRATTLKLVLVARRAHIWIEPLLWKVLVLGTYTSVRNLLGTIPSNGPAHIQHLTLMASTSLAETKQLLSICSNITNLSLWTAEVHVLSDLLRELQQPTKLARLSIEISLLDIQCAPLLTVTHLELEVLGDISSLALLPIFCALPALTHLAFAGEYAPELCKRILQACNDTLHLLVVVCERRDHVVLYPNDEEIAMAVEERVAERARARQNAKNIS